MNKARSMMESILVLLFWQQYNAVPHWDAKLVLTSRWRIDIRKTNNDLSVVTAEIELIYIILINHAVHARKEGQTYQYIPCIVWLQSCGTTSLDRAVPLPLWRAPSAEDSQSIHLSALTTSYARNSCGAMWPTHRSEHRLLEGCAIRPAVIDSVRCLKGRPRVTSFSKEVKQDWNSCQAGRRVPPGRLDDELMVTC